MLPRLLRTHNVDANCWNVIRPMLLPIHELALSLTRQNLIQCVSADNSTSSGQLGPALFQWLIIRPDIASLHEVWLGDRSDLRGHL